MLEHLNAEPGAPKRVVVLGAKGFVGGASVGRLQAEGVAVLALGRQELDLSAPDAARRLTETITPDDALLVISAKAPVKDHHMLAENIQMMTAVCDALQEVTPDHLVYISSDAVYADSDEPLTEASSAEPGSLHGVMHLARELMLQSVSQSPLAILRPTLIYGTDDPHNGYGPNQYRRLAAKGEPISLFGKGEERRDHVLIDDVAEIVTRVLFHRSRGVLNVATGDVASFHDIADMVAGHFDPSPEITYKPRSGPMPHGGYRPFDITACRQAFPGFEYTPLADGIAKAHG